MKRYIKLLLVTIISSFALTLNVNAETLNDPELENNNVEELQNLDVDTEIEQTLKPLQNQNTEPYTTISFTDDEIEIKVSEEKVITAVIDTNEDIENTITYTSNNTNIAIITEDGHITGIAEGETTITALTSNNKEATIKVTVKETLNNFEITNANIDLKPDTKPEFTAVSGSEIYTIEEEWTYTTHVGEVGVFDDDEYISISSNEEKNKYIEENGKVLEKIEEGKSYAYTVRVKIKKEYISKIDNQLINNSITINGQKYKFQAGGTKEYEDGSIEIGFENILIVTVPTRILESEIELSKDTFTYTGSEIKPVITVTKNNLELEKDKDYRVTYKNHTNAGMASVTVEGIGQYTNTISKDFIIQRKTINYNVDTIDAVIYTGQAITPSLSVKDGSQKLVVNKDYKVLYKNNINAGIATIIIEGIGNYKGKTTTQFIINKKESEIPSEAKNGKSIITGSKLSEVSLKTKGLKWVNTNTTIKKGNNQYQAIYLQNNDSSNYTPIDTYINVKGLSIIKINTTVDGGHGTVVASHTEILEGQLVKFNFKPDEGYRTLSVKLNNSQLIVNNDEYTIAAKDVDINLVVKFSPIEHTLTINGIEYVDIDSDSLTKVVHNGSKEIMITPKKGYKITSIRVNGIEKIKDLNNNILPLYNIISDTNIDIATEILIYRFNSGANQTYYSGEKNPLTFTINGNYKLLEKVYIDNKLVDSSNYNTEDGPTIINFKQKYISNLSYGTHTLKVVYSDGGEAKTTFVLSAKAITNPNTVDRIMSYIVVLMICLAIVIVVVYKKNNED